jgi:hypothetical protein
MLDLTVHNDTKHPMLVYAGELVEHGMQDRLLAESLIIAPGDSQVVSARCVEQLRSTGGWNYAATYMTGEVELRRQARFGDENTVWRRVDEINAALDMAPATRTLIPAAEKLDREHRARRDHLLAALAEMPDRDRVVGVAVAIDGRVVAIDRFASPALFGKLAPQLVSSYLTSERMTPVYLDVEGRPRTLSPVDVRDFAEGGETFTTVASATTLAQPASALTRSTE